jgi:hypothetical protein
MNSADLILIGFLGSLASWRYAQLQKEIGRLESRVELLEEHQDQSLAMLADDQHAS